MAQAGTVSTAAALRLANVRGAKGYLVEDPEQLPPEAASLTSAKNVSRYEVGTCFARSSEHPSGVYWVLMAVFVK